MFLLMIMVVLSVNARTAQMQASQSDEYRIVFNSADVTAFCYIAASSTLTVGQKNCEVINYVADKYNITVSSEVAGQILTDAMEKVCFILTMEGSIKVPCDQL
jgi:chemotaxis receptor (MCP) glutamine deamidase CheD